MTRDIWEYRKERGMGMEWISCKEQLPEDTRTVLAWTVYRACQEHNCVFFNGKHWYSEETDEILDCKVTHWMPLPEPPKQK
jgi:hypothetical protein